MKFVIYTPNMYNVVRWRKEDLYPCPILSCYNDYSTVESISVQKENITLYVQYLPGRLNHLCWALFSHFQIIKRDGRKWPSMLQHQTGNIHGSIFSRDKRYLRNTTWMLLQPPFLKAKYCHRWAKIINSLKHCSFYWFPHYFASSLDHNAMR